MSNDAELTLVTGASSGHFRSLLQFLQSVSWYEPSIPCFVYDLGLTEEETRRLKRRYPNCRICVFNFGAYPSHFDITINNGAYAWKPAIVWDVLEKSGGPVLWMDAGNTLTSDLSRLRQALGRNGFYSPYSPGNIQEWTHPGMFAALGLDGAAYGSERNLNGACMAFDPSNEKALRLARRWIEYARIQQCIAPEGSSRLNHRYDQALLSILAYEEGLALASDHAYLGFKPHQDVETYPARAFLRAARRTAMHWAFLAGLRNPK